LTSNRHSHIELATMALLWLWDIWSKLWVLID